MSSQSRILYNTRINKVKFSLGGSSDVEKSSFINVQTYDLVRNNAPYPGGVNDAHMGTLDYSYNCQTCYNNKHGCLGHPGHIVMNYPVWNPMFVSEGRKWLKLICFKCGKPIIDITPFLKMPREKILDEASRVSRVGNKRCIHCKEIHPIIKKNPSVPLALVAEFNEEKRVLEKRVIYPHNVGEILSRISDEDVVRLGKSVLSHPRNIILHSIQVPPVTARPDVKKIGGGRSTNDDLTSMLQIIIKRNEAMPSVVPSTIDPKLEKAIFDHNMAYFDFIKSGGDGMTSIARRLRGKTGRFRKYQMGKRIRNICRATIAGDPRIKIDEVGVPLVFARTIQYEEIVQEYNKKQLLLYVQNGRKRYPGATKIIKRNSGAEHDVDSAREIELENGDIVLRDMIDGDPVNFNRQPSLMISNISTHRVKIIRDPSVKTLLMNVSATPLYNADFDGDAMHIIISSGIAPRNEISRLSSVANWFISHTTSAPSIGLVDDAIIGTSELTRSDVKFNKYHAMLLFQNTTILPSFGHIGQDGITGRECVSLALADTPINFNRVPEWYKPNMAAQMKYDPSEIRVKIVGGKHLSGILDKKSICKGAAGGIYHIIANEYGADKALDVMFNMQQMAHSFLLQLGYTIGIMDLLVSDSGKKEIDSIATDIINKSKLITEELHNGEIIPSIGKTIEEFVEERQINTLNVFDDFTDPILRSINPKTNNLLKLIMVGSKGKLDNMYNMMSAIGQKLINGARINQNFGFKRTSPYFSRFDTSPAARGYITNSYVGGMTSWEYVFNACAARFDLISKALSTSVTGEQNRKSIKNLESIITNNFRWATKDRTIIQLVYGEDYLDPRKVERVKFPTIMISDEAFKTTYSRKGFDEFFAKMTADREKYRKIFLTFEKINVKELMSDERRMPVNIERVINDTIHEYNDMLKAPTDKILDQMVATVDALCEGIPYVLINEIQEKNKMKIPEHIRQATWLLTVLIRSYLHPNALASMKMTPEVLKIITDKIRLRYSQALIEPGTAVGIIAAQSFSEPLTQYMLDAHHRSASGGTSKSGMTKAREVLGARDTEKLENPSMLLPVIAEFAENKAKVQEIANNIEVMKFQRFVVNWQVFFEKFGEPAHSKYKHETTMIRDFLKLNPLLTPPGDLTKWCIRFLLNKTSLILKNMPLELIISRIRETFPETFVVYTPENARQIVLRIYMRAIMFKSTITTNTIVERKDSILSTVIRGVDGISNTRVEPMIRNKINPDGSISRVNNTWGIVTTGTNLSGILEKSYIDKLNVQTDAIQETYQMFGIEAARQKIISELRNIIPDINHRHYLIYADEMTRTGKVTRIDSSGLKVRKDNPLLRIGFSAPLTTMEESAINNLEDNISGVTAPLLIGSVPRIGTLYNSFYVNEEFVRKNVKRPDDIIETLFE